MSRVAVVAKIEGLQRVDHGLPAVEEAAVQVVIASAGSLIINVVDERPVPPEAVGRLAVGLKVSLLPAPTFGRGNRPAAASLKRS